MDNTSWRTNTNTDGDDTMFCLNCGLKIPSTATFCPYCGFNFQSVEDVSPPPPSPMPPKTSPMPPTPPVPPTPSVPPPPSPSTPSRPLLIIAAVVAMIATALVGFFIIAPMLFDRESTHSGESLVQVTTVSPEALTGVEDEGTAEHEEAADEPTEITEAPPSPTQIPTATPSPTPIPTAIPTPTPTSTPTPTPQQTINQVNIVDASTGQLIYIPNDTATSYAYPDSGSRLWSYGDVDGMTAGQVRYCINEIYAKNGYIFQNQAWLTYFQQKTWYTPSIPKASFGDHNLNSIEVANVKLLNQYYQNKKFPEY